ncbi:MAG: sulfite exporter TauE/SafE family protein [Gammaproteobacteria bacterium]|nr:sulfite exporter TauE/SafE family protein [Gammaproteobacteria bacterium]
MEVSHIILLLLAGVASGYINVLAGGGSILTVPLMIFMGMSGPVANGTNRVAVIAQSLASMWVFHKKGMAEWRRSLILSALALPGVVVGAWWGAHFDGESFRHFLSVIMVLVLVASVLEQRFSRKSENPGSWMWAYCLMPLVGFYGGLIQIGIGFLLMLILNRVAGLDLIRTNMHKVFVVLPINMVALVIFAWQSEIVWLAGAVLAVGNAVGAWSATHVMIRSGERLVRLTLYIVSAVFIVKLLWDV